MRYTGTINSWIDERGYGFITPSDGGRQVFVHINALAGRRRRPVVGEPVSYQLGSDARGRLRADQVRLAGKPVQPRSNRTGVGGALVLVAGLFTFLGAEAWLGELPTTVPLVYLAASVMAYAVYALDKSAARAGQWRIAESTLHLFALAGGWPGALLAQRALRHKSRKRSFLLVYWITVLVNCALLAWLFTPSAAPLRQWIL